MRSCGNHQCNRICCPLASLAGVNLKGKGKKKTSAAAAGSTQFDADPDGLHSSRGKQVLPQSPPDKRSFISKLAYIYRMDSQMVDVDPLRSDQIIRRIDTRIPTPLLSTYIASKSSSSSLGKLGNLRAGTATVHAPPAITPPGSRSATPLRGWTSVVAPPTATARAAAAVGPVSMLASTSAASPSPGTSTNPSRAATPPVFSPIPQTVPLSKSKASTTATGHTSLSVLREDTKKGDEGDNEVPDDWEDDE
ncbi:hypothetical protein D9757_007794 [Collybiopsis confluens]|uniref:Uncharacterized protein n=1 Tax=Collybiopsis confluens TaxID=2823264 RepID=A0A8H5MAK1_9AGAR|nr:hypothetical protein D9757_007794 [Collybiopsis confluens]